MQHAKEGSGGGIAVIIVKLTCFRLYLLRTFRSAQAKSIGRRRIVRAL